MARRDLRPRNWPHLASRIPGAVLRRVDLQLWRPAEEGAVRVERLLDRTTTPFAHFDTRLNDPRLSARMAECNSWGQTEYVHRITGDLLLDPHTGFVLTPGLRFVPASLPYDYQAHRPSTWHILAARQGLVPTLEFDRVISFRDVNERNYFHFFNDVLTKVPLLRSLGLLDAPVIIGRDLHTKRFHREIAPKLRSAGLQLVEQGDRVVRMKEVVFCKAMPLDRGHLDQVLDLVDAPNGDPPGQRRIFLDRSRSDTGERLIANGEAVRALVQEFGFEMHSTGTMSLRTQMELLRDTRWLIAVHGAAATNMLFRREAPLDLLELFPGDSLPPHYYWLSRTYGHGYQGVIGSPSERDGSFTLPLTALRTAIEELLRRA